MVTDANGCTSSETVVISEPASLTSSFTTSNWNGYEIQCNGGNNGDITLNVLGGVVALPYSYEIDGISNSTNFFSNLNAGTYIVDATDANGCITSETVTMTEPSTAIISSYTQSDFNGVGVSCNGDSDGSIDLSVTGGVGVHTYAWSNGSTSEDLSLIGAGTYSVVSTDNNGCTTTETIIITESVALTSFYTESDYNGFGVSCNGDSDGSIDLSVNGGVDNQNYTYVWNDAFTSEDRILLGAGTYSVVVTDANGCNTSETVIITEPDVFVGGQLSVSQTICQDGNLDSIINVFSPSGGNPPYTYDWEINNGSGFISLSNNNLDWIIPPAVLDTNIYKLIYSDDYQCNTFTELSTIIVNPLPETYSIVGDMSVCSNQSNAEYTLSTTPVNYRYEWFTNDGVIIGTNESRNCMIDWPSNPSTTADIEVIVSIEESGCNITTSSNVNISNNEAPNVVDVILKPSSNILACNDSTPGILYQWGFDLIATGISADLIGDTLQYVQLSSVPDTNINRYWVDTYFNYSSGISCITRSYYNEPPLPLDINEINIYNFSIYPNPVTEVLFFNYESSNKIELKVIDLLGRSIDCMIDYENKSIRFKDIKPSIYMLVVKSNKSEFIKKFIIK